MAKMLTGAIDLNKIDKSKLSQKTKTVINSKTVLNI
jgi:hypothetical protein